MAGRKLESLDSPVVTAHLDPDVARRTRTLAAENGRSLSSLVSDGLRLYFARVDRIAALYSEAVAVQEDRVAAITLDVTRAGDE